MKKNVPHYKTRMARPKKHTERMTASFLTGTFNAMRQVQGADEDRTELVRLAVDFLIRLRTAPAYQHLAGILRAGETDIDMAVKGFTQLVALRREALAAEDLSLTRGTPAGDTKRS